MAEQNTSALRKTAEAAVVSVARCSESPVAVLGGMLRDSEQPQSAASILRVLSSLGQDEALQYIHTALAADDAEVTKAAVRALCDWPTDAALGDLARLAEESATEAERIVALRGYLRQVRNVKTRPTQITLACYQTAAGLAQNPEEKRAILSGLSTLIDREAQALAEDFLDDSTVEAEAKLAVERIRRSFFHTSASENSRNTYLGIDSEPDTAWNSISRQQPGLWFQVDQGELSSIGRIELKSGPLPENYPRKYELYVSDSPTDWGGPVASGRGVTGTTAISFTPVQGRFVRIVQTGKDPDHVWSVQDIRILPE
jgi:hypothetical protein